MTKKNWSRLIIWLMPAVLLIIALTQLPYSYYQFLRIVVCIAAGYLAYSEFKLKDKLNIWAIVFALLVVLFNPIITIHLAREVWAFFDVITAVIFIVHLIMQIRKNNFL